MLPARLLFTLVATLAGLSCQAQTSVSDAWVRGTVAQQKATGAFMQLTSRQGGKLVSVSSPLAALVEIHEMSMDGSTMKMRAVASVDLPPGKSVQLTSGGYHVMLMDLKAALKGGDTVPLTLVVQGLDGKRETIEVKAAVKALGATDHKH